MEATTLGALARAIGAPLPAAAAGLAERPLTSVSTDTRALRPGALFCALDGERHRGADFVEAAFARGARAVVVGAPAPGARPLPDPSPGRPVLAVPCARRALGDLAAAYRAGLPAPVVAITGSAGKTTTKELLAHVLAGTGLRVVRPRASFNNDVGLPLTLLEADRATDVVVLEAGTSGPGELDRLGAIARPDLAAITCIGASHLERLGSVEGVAREKLSLLARVAPGGRVCLGGDDARLRAATAGLRARGLEVRLAGLAAGADLRMRLLPAGAPEAGASGRALALVRARRAGRAVQVELPVPGRAFAQSAAVALSLALELGVPLEAAAAALTGFRAPAGRCRVEARGGALVVDDCYNANPTSVLAALDTLAGLAPAPARVAVLGPMAELGQDGPAHHAEVGRAVARLGLDLLVVVGEAAGPLADGALAGGLAPERVVRAADPEAALAALRPALGPGRVVLVKGSRVARLERVVAGALDHLSARGPTARAA